MKSRRYRQRKNIPEWLPLRDADEQGEEIRINHRNRAVFIASAIAVMAFLLFLVSCKSSQQFTTVKTEYNDSISRLVKENARLLKIPLSSAELNLNFENLSDLPIGATYTEKQGQATVSVEKTGDSDYRITATCDSLTELIVERETEIYRLRNKFSELSDKVDKVTTVEVYRQTNWQIVCGWFGKVFMAVIGIGIIVLILKWKKKLPF